MPAGFRPDVLKIKAVGALSLAPVKQVGSENSVCRRKLMIEPHREEIFCRDLIRQKCEGRDRSIVASRVDLRSRRKDFRGYVPDGRIRSAAIEQSWRRHGVEIGHGLALPQPFVIGKEECIVFDDWPARGRAELVAFKG